MKIFLTFFSILIFTTGLIAQVVDNKGSIKPLDASKWDLNTNDISNKAPATAVGIGITNPNAELHINGDLRVDILNDVVSANDWIFVDATAKTLSKELVRIGDIKYGFQTGDHQGWFLLDGRAITTLTTNQQAYAAELGFTGNLPDANERYLTQNTGALGATTGNSSITVLQANLPNYDMELTACDTTGNHQHNYTRWAGGRAKKGTRTPRPLGNGNTLSNSGASGDHSHTISTPSGGDGTPIDLNPQSMSVHTFIFLGTI